ncbi:MAG: glycosyltransferase, partial [Candidatus Omnitrophota bacterium]
MSPTLPENNIEHVMKSGVNRKVIVVAGKSCGHIYPALSFIDALKEKYKDAEVLLILPKENAIKNKQEFNCQVKHISFSPLRPGFDLNNIKCFSKLIEACFQAIFIISDFNPN